MHKHLELALALGFGAFSASPTFGQSFQIRPQLAESWAVSTSTPVPASASLLMWGSTPGRRRNPLATRGARIGFAVGLVAGAVYWSARKCDGSACLIKWTFMPFGTALFGFFGMMIGAGIDRIASGGANYAHAPTNPGPHLRVGVTLGF